MVFTDFTAASSIAAGHCYQLASLVKAEVRSFHVVSSDDDRDWAEAKSIEQMRKLPNYDAGVPFTPLASSRNLFKGLNTWLHEQHVGLTFMATHGKKDVQFVTGSNALKLIFNAEVPTLVVQQGTPVRPYRHILLPLLSHQAEMQFPVEVLQAMVRTFGSKVTLLTPAEANSKEQDELKKAVDRISGTLQDVAPGISVKSSEQPEKKWSKSVVNIVQEEGADLIAVLVGAKHHRKEAEKTKKFYQALITNEHGVPVLCL